MVSKLKKNKFGGQLIASCLFDGIAANWGPRIISVCIHTVGVNAENLLIGLYTGMIVYVELPCDIRKYKF